jgi:hypothetical protein
MLPVIYSMSVSLDGFIAGPSTLSRPATGAAVANVTMISPGVRECSTTAPYEDRIIAGQGFTLTNSAHGPGGSTINGDSNIDEHREYPIRW